MPSALQKLRDELVETMKHTDMAPKDIMAFIDQYIEDDQKQYQTNKENNCLTFGKYRGFKISEISANEKGRDYLGWLLSQTWCTPDKFAYIHEECEALNIKKKIARRGPMI